MQLRVMRVVAGTARGRRLVAPKGDDVRPTGDRVREAVFNALGSMGVLLDAEVLDLFAGSGAMGIEALSRGALHATFVDSSRRSLDAVRANLAACGFSDRATVVHSDGAAFLRADPARRFDVAVLDPPYGFDGWTALLAEVRGDVVVIESDREIDPGPASAVLRQRRYGSTVVTIVGPKDRDEHGRTSSEDRS